MSHIAVASNCEQIKTGSLPHSNRLTTYNKLMRIGSTLEESVN